MANVASAFGEPWTSAGLKTPAFTTSWLSGCSWISHPFAIGFPYGRETMICTGASPLPTVLKSPTSKPWVVLPVLVTV